MNTQFHLDDDVSWVQESDERTGTISRVLCPTEELYLVQPDDSGDPLKLNASDLTLVYSPIGELLAVRSTEQLEAILEAQREKWNVQRALSKTKRKQAREAKQMGFEDVGESI